jgi:hypothetical protein
VQLVKPDAELAKDRTEELVSQHTKSASKEIRQHDCLGRIGLREYLPHSVE